MVLGLDTFRKHFRDYSDSYILIGGSACDIVMKEAGVAFRVTKDLDIVLIVESLNREFGEAFWDFIRRGGYGRREVAEREKRYYRFSGPKTGGYPVMLELFSRQPDTLLLPLKSHLTPLHIDDEVSSLSAILISDEYYNFLRNGKTIINDLSLAGPPHLIPLKARAWLDLTARKAQGIRVDSKVIKKHRNDVFRLFTILDPAWKQEIPEAIKDDMHSFFEKMEDENINFKALGLGKIDSATIRNQLATIYGFGG